MSPVGSFWIISIFYPSLRNSEGKGLNRFIKVYMHNHIMSSSPPCITVKLFVI